MKRQLASLWAVAAVAALVPAVLCARRIELELAEVPAAVLEAAKRAVPGFTAVEAELESKKRGGRFYEIAGHASGRRYEIEISANGEVVSLETKGAARRRFGTERGAVPPASLPRSQEPSSRTVTPPTVTPPIVTPPTVTKGAVLPRAARHSPPSPRIASSSTLVGAVEVLDLPSPDSEIVSAFTTASGTGLAVVSPGAACGGEGEASHLVIVEGADAADLDRARIETFVLGLGEATSVASHPRGEMFLLAIKDPVHPNTARGRVDVIAGSSRVASLRVGAGPDAIAVSPAGDFAIVACEGSAPDEDECDEEDPDADAAGSLHVIDLREGASNARVVAVIGAEEIHRRFLAADPRRAGDPRDVEPEYISVAHDGSFALVTLQEQSAVVAVDLDSLRGDQPLGSPEAAGSRALAGAVLLPHGARDAAGIPRGVQPDGIAISPDDRFAITANEGDSGARHLQGLSVIDLRGGPRSLRLVATHSIFDVDPTLLGRPKDGRRGRDDGGPRKLPRVDPEGVTFVESAGRTIAAMAIERKARGEQAGSALFLDVTSALDGGTPVPIARRIVGASRGARPEGITTGPDGRFVYVASQRDGGTLTRIPITSAGAAAFGPISPQSH